MSRVPLSGLTLVAGHLLVPALYILEPGYQLVLEGGKERMTVTVLNETKNLYQYFDATPQAEYLYECAAETIEKDLREQIGFIQRYDRALDETKEIVDMPDKRASLLVRLILQNKGRLAKNKRDLFSEVTDEELTKIEKVIGSVEE